MTTNNAASGAGRARPEHSLNDAIAALERLGCKPKLNGKGYQSLCPIHEADGGTHTPSLSIAAGNRQPFVLTCRAGCDQTALIKALNLPAPTGGRGNVIATYPYRALNGAALFEKVRFDPKDFRIRHSDNGRHVYRLPQLGKFPLYRLPELRKAVESGETVFYVEGEKDVDRLASLGQVATTNFEGASQDHQKPKWRPEYTEQLTGANCLVLIPDNDAAGRAHLMNVAKQMRGKVDEIVWLELPGLPQKGDVSDWLNAGHGIEELRELIAKAGSPPPDVSPDVPTPEPEQTGTAEQIATPRFVWANEFCALPPNEVWTIRDYLEPDTLAVLYGDSETFKSFLAVDLCGHVATGKDWRGKKVKPGIALYVAGEGGNGLRKRIKAWFERHNEPIRNIAISTVPLSLCDPANTAALVADIKALLAGNPNPSIIVLDTLNTHFGGDENSTAEMTKFVAGIRDLRIATGATILVVHHCGHAAKDRSRGSISLRNGIDWEYRMERAPESQTTTLVCTKSKDADKPAPLAWTLEKQPLPWIDNDGVPMASCVLVPASVPEQTGTNRLGDKQQAALDVLKNLLAEHQANLSNAGIDPENARVSVKDWYAAMKLSGLSRSRCSEFKSRLLELGLIKLDGGGYVLPV